MIRIKLGNTFSGNPYYTDIGATETDDGYTIVTAGISGAGKTVAMLNRIEYFSNCENTTTVVFCKHEYEYKEFIDKNNVFIVDYKHAYENNLGIHDIIDKQQNINNEVLVVIDTSVYYSDDYLLKLWIDCKNNNYIVNITSMDISGFPIKIVDTAAMYEIFNHTRLMSNNKHMLKLIGLNYLMHRIDINILNRGEKLLLDNGEYVLLKEQKRKKDV